MKVNIDIGLIRKLTSANDEKERESLLNKCFNAVSCEKSSSLHFVLSRSSLLEYLGMGSLFDSFPKPEDQNKIFSSVIDVLKMDSEQDVIIYLYDQIFVECLTQVKSLQFIQPQILLEKIHHKRKNPLILALDDPFLASLEEFEKNIRENP